MNTESKHPAHCSECERLISDAYQIIEGLKASVQLRDNEIKLRIKERDAFKAGLEVIQDFECSTDDSYCKPAVIAGQTLKNILRES